MVLIKTWMVIFLFVVAGSGWAQTKTYVGIKGGGHVNSAFLEHTIFNFNAKITFHSGFHGGVFIKHFPTRKDVTFNTGIQGSINYVQKGWTQAFPDSELPDYRITMNYMEIPVEGIGYFGRKNKYFVAAGFYAEVFINVIKDPSPVHLENFDFVTYEGERDRKAGYGGRVSGGVFRDFPFGSLHLEGFFTYSFSNFVNAGDLTNDQLPNVSNLWNAGISIGYLVSFGKLDILQ